MRAAADTQKRDCQHVNFTEQRDGIVVANANRKMAVKKREKAVATITVGFFKHCKCPKIIFDVFLLCKLYFVYPLVIRWSHYADMSL